MNNEYRESILKALREAGLLWGTGMKRVSLTKQSIPSNNGLVGWVTRNSLGEYSFRSDPDGIVIEGLSDKQFREVSPKYKGRKLKVVEDVVERKEKKIVSKGGLRIKQNFKCPLGMSGEDFSVKRLGVGPHRYKVYAAKRPGDATNNPSALFVNWQHLAFIEHIDEAYLDCYVIYCNEKQLKEIKSWAKSMNFSVGE